MEQEAPIPDFDVAAGFDAIIGQARAVEMLKDAAARGKLPHALLFTGIDGIGKRTAGILLAMRLNCEEPADPAAQPCGRCRACVKIRSGVHPDVRLVTPINNRIRIDRIRDLIASCVFRPAEGRARVVVMSDADRMNTEASNALLKLLEEPPVGTHLILTATESENLLPTVVSRCREIRFSPLSPEVLSETLLPRTGVDQRRAETLARLSGGSYGKALSMAGDHRLAWRKRLFTELTTASANPIPRLFSLAERLSREKNALADLLEMLVVCFRDVAVFPRAPDRLVNVDLAESIETAAHRFTPAESARIADEIQRAIGAIEKNANPRLTLETLFIGMADAT